MQWLEFTSQINNKISSLEPITTIFTLRSFLCICVSNFIKKSPIRKRVYVCATIFIKTGKVDR